MNNNVIGCVVVVASMILAFGVITQIPGAFIAFAVWLVVGMFWVSLTAKPAKRELTSKN